MRNNHSRVSDPNSFITKAGNKFHVLYDSFFNSDGTIRLKEAGRKDIQAEINSHVAETDMAVIVSKLQRGDISVLTSKKPMYGDFTTLPTTFAEVYDLVSRSEQAFEALDPDIKQQFDNDRAKWFSTIGTSQWFEKMGITPPAPPASPASEPSVIVPDVVKEKEIIE